MHLDHEELHRILASLAESDIQEFSLEGKDFHLEVKRNLGPIKSPEAIFVSSNTNQQEITPQPISSPPVPSNPPPAVASTPPEFIEVTAPMVGTFYRAPAPGEPVFVEVGSRVAVGQTVCILEAMKLMNELESDIAGEVIEILVENGTPVEFGQVLMKVKPN